MKLALMPDNEGRLLVIAFNIPDATNVTPRRERE